MSCCYTEKILCPQKYLAWGAIHYYFVQKKTIWILYGRYFCTTHRHMHAWYYYNLRSVCIVLLFITYYPCGSIAWPISEGHSLAKSAHSIFFSIQPPSMHFFFIHPKRCNFSLIPSYMMRIFLLSKAGWQFDIMRVVTTAKIPFELCAKRMLTKSPDNMNNPFLILCCSIHTKSSVAGNSPTNCHVMVNDDRRKREVRAEGGGEAF